MKYQFSSKHSSEFIQYIHFILSRIVAVYYSDDHCFIGTRALYSFDAVHTFVALT